MSVHDHRDMDWTRPAPTSGLKAPHLNGTSIEALLAKLGNRIGMLIWDVENAYGRARRHDRAQDDPRFRIFMVMAAFSLVFIILAGGASYAALFADKGRVGYGTARPMLSRGDIVDRNGMLMATNITHYGLYIDPREVWDRDLARTQLMQALPRISAKKLDRVLDGDRRLIVATGLTPQERMAVHALALGGVTFEPEDRRVYPLGASASHLLGRADTGGQGVAGVELAFDNEIRSAGVAGGAYPLSIDMRVQGIVENELATAVAEHEAKAGIAVVADVHTGEIIAMASWPTYDPNRPITNDNNATLNRVTSAHYEMGSIFKSFAVAAGIDTGRADRNTLFDASKPFFIGNRRISDFHAKNKVMTLEEVFIHSSNIGTSRLAVEMGTDVMRDYFKRLGLLDAAPIELHESNRPTYPARWGDSTLASLSFGYSIMTTPLQAVAAYGALTNGGQYVPLTLRRGGNPNAQTRRVVSAETSATMLELMRSNVVNGSGGRANAPGLRVGGKTGSANKLVNGRYNPMVAVGSFAAVFPSDGPLDAKRYSVFVLLDEPTKNGRTGGLVAAPAVGRIADRSAEFLGIPRKADKWFTATGERIPQPQIAEGLVE